MKQLSLPICWLISDCYCFLSNRNAISCAVDDILIEKLSVVMESINAIRHYTRI
jgi:hypothetical protein